MRLYRWKKPILVLSLVEGGSLAANTTYYLLGFFISLYKNISSFHGASSPRSDLYSIATTSTHKSINVYWKTIGNITKYEDAGGGNIRVTSDLHCLDTGNIVIVESGIYSGSYVITWESYNTFLIATAFLGDETSTWYCQVFPNQAQGLKLWMDISDPLVDNIFQGNMHKLSHPYYTIGYTANNILINTLLSSDYNNKNIPEIEAWGKAYKYIYEVGVPSLYGTESTLVFSDINEAFIDSGVYPYMFATPYRLSAFCYFDFLNLTNTLNNVQIDLIGTCLYGGSLSINKSNFSSTRSRHRSLLQFIAKTSVVYCDSSPDLMPVNGDAYNTFIMRAAFYPTLVGHVFDSYKIVNTYGSNSFDFLYPVAGVVKNTEFIGGYIYWVNRDLPAPHHCVMQNVLIISAGGSFNYDIVHYSYTEGGYVIDNFNVDTLRPNNEKYVLCNNPNNLNDFHFYRKGTITIKNKDNEVVVEANITIIDSEGNEYEYTTDDNGEFTYYVLEQIAYGAYMSVNNLLIIGFTFTISKEGYQDHVVYYDILKGIDGLDVFLTEVIPPIYINQSITGNIETNEITGSIQTIEITGEIIN